MTQASGQPAIATRPSQRPLCPAPNSREMQEPQPHASITACFLLSPLTLEKGEGKDQRQLSPAWDRSWLRQWQQMGNCFHGNRNFWSFTLSPRPLPHTLCPIAGLPSRVQGFWEEGWDGVGGDQDHPPSVYQRLWSSAWSQGTGKGRRWVGRQNPQDG